MSFDMAFKKDGLLDKQYIEKLKRGAPFVVDAWRVKSLVILYLCGDYKGAFGFFEKNFNFLFDNIKWPICNEWYHDKMRRILKMVADRPYDERYLFAKKVNGVNNSQYEGDDWYYNKR